MGEEEFLDHYILRVYRLQKNNPKKLVGLIEEVGIEGRKAFTSIEELWGILKEPVREGRPKKSRSAKSRKRGSL